MFRPFRFILLGLALLIATLSGTPAALANTLEEVRTRGTLTWGTDVEGNEPYVYPDPQDPNKYIGFEAEIGHALGRRLGVKAQLIHNAWDGLIPALERKSFDMAMNGLEVTADRQEKILFSRPYYVYTQQLVVRNDERGLTDLASLSNKRVGTLAGSVAQRLLEARGDVEIKLYPSNVQPFDDLLLKRLDAVLLDLPMATVYGNRPGLKFAGEPFGAGYYAIGFRKDDKAFKAQVDSVLTDMMKDGELEAILRKYNLWNAAQKDLIQLKEAPVESSKRTNFQEQLAKSAPMLLKGTIMTVSVSILAMALAILLGITLATMRLYGNKAMSAFAAAYVELFRGTPLLVQLFLIYYGLPTLGVQLDAFMAAIIGLGMNYAAYEAENYRAGLLALPKGQQEAALALGMNRWQALRFVLFPQSFRLVIPPVTNDFIALFKDSSVVSIITMVELTKVYGMLASSTYNYIGFGLVTAAIYFAISYPTSLFARWVENRLRVA